MSEGLKNQISKHILGAKGLDEKTIREYYKRLKDLRGTLNKSYDDKEAIERYFELEGGLRFFYQEWLARSNNNERIPKMIVIALHDAYNCSDIFYPLADFLNPNGILVVSLDYRGHGRTGGQAGGNLGDIASFQEIYDDIANLITKYRREFDLPICLVGYDIGGLIALQVAVRYPTLAIAGLVLLSPIWRLKSTMKHLFLYPVVTLGQTFLKGNTTLSTNPEIPRSTYFPEYQSFIQNNPFHLEKISLRMFHNILDLISTTHRLRKKCLFPVLIQQGTADEIGDHFAVHRLYEQWPHPNKFVRFYENAGHNLLMDRFTQSVYSEILRFLKELKPESVA